MEVTRPSALKGTYMMIISQGLRRRSFTRIGFIYILARQRPNLAHHRDSEEEPRGRGARGGH